IPDSGNALSGLLGHSLGRPALDHSVQGDLALLHLHLDTAGIEPAVARQALAHVLPDGGFRPHIAFGSAPGVRSGNGPRFLTRGRSRRPRRVTTLFVPHARVTVAELAASGELALMPRRTGRTTSASFRATFGRSAASSVRTIAARAATL